MPLAPATPTGAASINTCSIRSTAVGAFGWRFEWFDDPQGYVVTGLRPGNTDARFRFPGSFYETSLGLNYKPNGNLTIRPELRYDWYDGPGGFTSPGVPGNPPNQPFGDNANKNQFLFGLGRYRPVLNSGVRHRGALA